MKKKFLLLLLVLQACVLKGQLDSIELQIRIDRISNKEGVATSIIKDYLALLEHYHLTNDQNAVLEYTESALRFAKEKKDTSALIELYSRWINKIWHEGEIETYLKYYREGSQFFKENNLENEYLNIIVNHSIFLAANRSFDESLKLKNNGIELAKKLNNVQVLGSIYYDLGETYLDFSNFSLALLNYNKAINSIGSDPFNWTFYYSISGAIDSYYGIYKETKNPTLIDSMKVNLELLKRPFDEGKIDDFLYQYVINSEIYINVLENRTDQLDLKLKTLEELSRNFSYTPLADAYTTLYDYRILKGDHRKAISYLDKAIELNKSSKPKPSYRELVSNYRKLSDSYRFLGNDKLAYSYLYQSSRLKDSLKNDSHEKNLKELELKYETLEKETENKELALKNQILQQRNKYFLFGLLGSILLLGFVLFANYKVKKANRVIEAQRDELESTNQTKDRLFSIIGHDLRKPILGIQGIGKKLAYLNEKGDQELLNKLLRSVDQNSQNLMILINNLLSWTKFQKSYRTIELSSFNIGDLVEENHQFFDLRLAEKNLKFEVIGRPFDVHSNSDALSTIVRNIIDNSIKYSKEGDLIELLFAEEDNQKKMSLKDKGKGMDAEQLRNLKLGKGINSEKGTHGEMGVGLGWQIIYDLSRRLNIDVDIKSEINRGTTIELTFN